MERRHTLPQRLGTEVLGTFALTFASASSGILHLDELSHAMAPAMVLTAMTYALGNVSGAHFNPAVSLAFTLRGAFRWRHLIPYVLAQMVGSILAGLALSLFFGDVLRGRSVPLVASEKAFGYELLLTMLHATVSLGVATRHRLVGAEAALAVGASITFCGIVGVPVTGASMNPARSLGPALVSGGTSQLWIYLTAPFAGAALAVLIASVLHSVKHEGESEAAQGD